MVGDFENSAFSTTVETKCLTDMGQTKNRKRESRDGSNSCFDKFYYNERKKYIRDQGRIGGQGAIYLFFNIIRDVTTYCYTNGMNH